MKADKTYAEFDVIVADIYDSLKDFKGQMNDLELEIKYGLLKKTSHPDTFKKIQIDSQKHPIIMNERKDHKFHKINANASKEQIENVEKNLGELRKKNKFQLIEKDSFFLNQRQQRFNYEIGRDQWFRILKELLFSRQYDVVSQGKMFRISLSQKFPEQKNILQKLRKLIKNQEACIGIMRFKRIKEYHVNQLFIIQVNRIYQSQAQADFKQIKQSLFEEDPKVFQKCMLDILERELKKETFAKLQIELKVTCEGNEMIKDLQQDKMNIFFSKIFDFCRDMTKEKETDELSELMMNMNLK